MTVHIHADPIVDGRGSWRGRRWYWRVTAHRGGSYIDRADGFCYTRIGATIARDRAVDRLRRTHGGGA